MALEPNFARLASLCLAGHVMAFILLLMGWNFGMAARGVLKLLGLFGKVSDD